MRTLGRKLVHLVPLMACMGCTIAVDYSDVRFVPAGVRSPNGELDRYDRITCRIEADRDLLELSQKEHSMLGWDLVLVRGGEEVNRFQGYIVALGDPSVRPTKWEYLAILRFGEGITRERLGKDDYDGFEMVVMLRYMVSGAYKFSQYRGERAEIIAAVAAGMRRDL